MSNFDHKTNRNTRKPTPEQEDLERRIREAEIKNEKTMGKLYEKIAHIRTKIR